MQLSWRCVMKQVHAFMSLVVNQFSYDWLVTWLLSPIQRARRQLAKSIDPWRWPTPVGLREHVFFFCCCFFFGCTQQAFHDRNRPYCIIRLRDRFAIVFTPHRSPFPAVFLRLINFFFFKYFIESLYNRILISFTLYTDDLWPGPLPLSSIWWRRRRRAPFPPSTFVSRAPKLIT